MATLAGRPSSSYRLRAPAPAGPRHWRHEEQWHERPGLSQFVYLAMLLHAIAILLFGAPQGGSRDGRAMWGSLNVTLVGPVREIALPPRLEPIAPIPLPKLEREMTPREKIPEKTAKPPPVLVPPKIERIAPPPLKLEKTLPIPKLDVIPAPLAPPMAMPAPMQPIAPQLPSVERTMVQPPSIEVPIAQPVEIPRIETQALPTIPASPALPEMAKPVEVAVPKEVTAPTPPAPPAPPARPVSPPEPAIIPSRIVPSAEPPPLPRPRTPADTGYDPTQPSIDLDAARRRAGQIAREGTGQRAVLPFPMPAPPERKTKTEEALDKARKPDCRTAYKDMGLLAAVPLIANEFGEGTCRW